MDDGADDDTQDRWPAGDGDVADPTPHNGHLPGPDAPAHAEEAHAAGWVSAGGVLRWEPGESEGSPPAHSPLAAEALEMPEGAPDAPRVEAVRAWLLRKREAAGEDVGALLLRQREERHAEPPTGRRPRRGPEPPSAVDRELAEQQAALDEYSLLLDALDETVEHAGPARALIEYYLWLAERLEGLAADSRALLADAVPDPLAVSAWNGRAQAVVVTRGRVERMMAPAADD